MLAAYIYLALICRRTPSDTFARYRTDETKFQLSGQSRPEDKDRCWASRRWWSVVIFQIFGDANLWWLSFHGFCVHPLPPNLHPQQIMNTSLIHCL